MNKENCFQLGTIAKLHGFKGEVSLFLDVTNPSDYDDLEMIFVDLNDQLTPFFIEHSKIRNNGYLTVKLENIDSEIAAKRIVRRKVYLPEEILPVLEGNNFYDHEIVGYTVIDKNYGEVGILEMVIDNKVNPLLQINHNGTEVLLPLIDGLIQKLEREKRELYVNAPQGLIELYLGS